MSKGVREMSFQDAEGWLRKARGKGWLKPRYSQESEIIGWEAGPVVMEYHGAAEGQAVLARALQPAASLDVTRELHRLRVLTKARQQSQAEIDEALTLFGDELKGYPLEVIRRACREQARESPFWPALAELVTRCDREVRPLRQAQAILEKVRHAA
jgi:hypothetical protein